MKSKFIIEEDTVSEYADKLLAHFQDTQEILLDNISERVSNVYIEPYVPVWDEAENLYESGEDPENWFKHISTERSVVEILYTGFTEFAQQMYVWFEMGGFSTQKETSLKRDYAYYQETGIDMFHGSYPKAEKFEGHHYVERGTLDYSGDIHKDIERYLAQVLQLYDPSMGQQIF